jgi:hypothetical protein
MKNTFAESDGIPERKKSFFVAPGGGKMGHFAL